jgi:hypothetical protein
MPLLLLFAGTFIAGSIVGARLFKGDNVTLVIPSENPEDEEAEIPSESANDDDI